MSGYKDNHYEVVRRERTASHDQWSQKLGFFTVLFDVYIK